MLAQGDGSQASIGFEGVKTLRAAAVESMNSIEEIHAKETKLQKNISEESKALMDSLDKRLYNVIDSIATKSGHNGIMDTYNVGNILQEAAKAKKWNGKAVKDTFNKYPDWKVSDADIKEIVDIVNELKELPTDMFEAKPERVVGYDEVAAVVVPDTTPESLIDKAKERGLKVVQYDPIADLLNNAPSLQQW